MVLVFARLDVSGSVWRFSAFAGVRSFWGRKENAHNVPAAGAVRPGGRETKNRASVDHGKRASGAFQR